jgi:hypothetical protein
MEDDNDAEEFKTSTPAESVNQTALIIYPAAHLENDVSKKFLSVWDRTTCYNESQFFSLYSDTETKYEGRLARLQLLIALQFAKKWISSLIVDNSLLLTNLKNIFEELNKLSEKMNLFPPVRFMTLEVMKSVKMSEFEQFSKREVKKIDSLSSYPHCLRFANVIVLLVRKLLLEI